MKTAQKVRGNEMDKVSKIFKKVEEEKTDRKRGSIDRE